MWKLLKKLRKTASTSRLLPPLPGGSGERPGWPIGAPGSRLLPSRGDADVKCLQYFLKNPSKVLLNDFYKGLTVLFRKLKCLLRHLKKMAGSFHLVLPECKHCCEWKELKERLLSLEILFLNKRGRKSFFWLILIIQVKVSGDIQLNGKQKRFPLFFPQHNGTGI